MYLYWFMMTLKVFIVRFYFKVFLCDVYVKEKYFYQDLILCNLYYEERRKKI